MGGSGGGSSGAVSYPAYMQTIHEVWLTDINADIGGVQSNDPYALAAPYDPDTELAAMLAAVGEFQDAIEALIPSTEFANFKAGLDLTTLDHDESNFDSLGSFSFADDLTAFMASLTPETLPTVDKTLLTAFSQTYFDAINLTLFNLVKTDVMVTPDEGDLHEADTTIVEAAHLTSVVTAFTGQLDDDMLDVIARYRRGMQNIGAVMTSAYQLGEALIRARQLKEISKFTADLHFKNEEKQLQFEQIKVAYNNALTAHRQMADGVNRTKVDLVGKEIMFYQMATTAELANQKLLVDAEIEYNKLAFDLAIRWNLYLMEYQKGRITHDELKVRYRQIQSDYVVKMNAMLSQVNEKRINQHVMLEQLRCQTSLEIVNDYFKSLELLKAYTHYNIEGNRLKIIAKSEETQEGYAYDEKSSLWGMEAWQYGANMLGSIAGTAIPTQKTPSKGASALGGALSGAAAGASVGGAYGAAIGAVIGGIGGLLSS